MERRKDRRGAEEGRKGKEGGGRCRKRAGKGRKGGRKGTEREGREAGRGGNKRRRGCWWQFACRSGCGAGWIGTSCRDANRMPTSDSDIGLRGRSFAGLNFLRDYAPLWGHIFPGLCSQLPPPVYACPRIAPPLRGVFPGLNSLRFEPASCPFRPLSAPFLPRGYASTFSILPRRTYHRNPSALAYPMLLSSRRYSRI